MECSLGCIFRSKCYVWPPGPPCRWFQLAGGCTANWRLSPDIWIMHRRPGRIRPMSPWVQSTGVTAGYFPLVVWWGGDVVWLHGVVPERWTARPLPRPPGSCSDCRLLFPHPPAVITCCVTFQIRQTWGGFVTNLTKIHQSLTQF